MGIAIGMFQCTFLLLCFISTSKAVHSVEKLDEHPADSQVIQQLIKRLSDLESRDRNKQLQVDQLRAEVHTQKEEIRQFRETVEIKDRQIHDLVKEMSNGDQDGRSVIKRDTAEAQRKRRFENEATVAFFAGLSTSIQQSGDHQTIVFDNVEINTGNGYNSHSGVFIAPVSGTYVFTASIMTFSGRKVCEMVVNGTRKAQIYTHGDGHYDHGSQTLIVQLNKGDDVAIQINEHTSTIYGETPPYTTFSGFLLQEDYSNPATVVG